MGTPEYASTILAALFKAPQCEVVAVFTRPDKPVGRKQVLTPPDVKKFLLLNHPDTPIFQPRTLKDESVQASIKELKPDFIVVAAYGQILPQAVLDIAPCINLHASILPKYRGASPIQAALMAGESQTGVTAMLMDAGLDTGDILKISKINCEHKMASELFAELADMAASLIVDVLLDFKNITPIKQDGAKATHCAKIKKELGLVDFSMSAEQIYNMYRALSPWPGLFLQSGLKLLDLELYKGELKFDKAKNGEILKISGNGVLVACGEGVLGLKTLQAVGKKPVSAKDYINGKRLGVGDKIY